MTTPPTKPRWPAPDAPMSDAGTQRRNGSLMGGDMKIIDVWEALEHQDKSEGRGGLRRIGIFQTESGARDAAIHMGVMGTDGEVTKRQALLTDGAGTYMLESDTVKVHDGHGSLLRERALKKIAQTLSPEERRAVGL